MTEKDFELIARVLRENKIANPVWSAVVSAFARELRSTNPRFDVERFRAACGEGVDKMKSTVDFLIFYIDGETHHYVGLAHDEETAIVFAAAISRHTQKPAGYFDEGANTTHMVTK